MFRKTSVVDDGIKTRLLRRLRSTSDADLIRWIDNIHMGIGKNISEMRKSLNREDPTEALTFIDDTRTGAVSLLAAMQALEERLTRP